MSINVHCLKNRLLQSCTYIIETKYLYLIDCGDYEAIVQTLQSFSKELKGLFLTHCHQDHIYGLEYLIKKFPSLKIYCSSLTAQGLSNEEMNLTYIIPEYRVKITDYPNIIVVSDGKYIIDDIKIAVLETPGHSDDCLCYIIEKNIFTGDSYIPFTRVFTKWPRSNKQLAIENETKLKEMIEIMKYKVFSGHWI